MAEETLALVGPAVENEDGTWDYTVSHSDPDAEKIIVRDVFGDATVDVTVERNADEITHEIIEGAATVEIIAGTGRGTGTTTFRIIPAG